MVAASASSDEFPDLFSGFSVKEKTFKVYKPINSVANPEPRQSRTISERADTKPASASFSDFGLEKLSDLASLDAVTLVKMVPILAETGLVDSSTLKKLPKTALSRASKSLEELSKEVPNMEKDKSLSCTTVNNRQ